MLFYSLFFILLNIPNYHWYYAPYYIFMFFYSGIGLGWGIKNFYLSKDKLFKFIGLFCAVSIGGWLIYSSLLVSNKEVKGLDNINNYATVGKWYREEHPC